MGQCIITRRGGGVETEPYNFYTDTNRHSLFTVKVNTSGVTSLSSGTCTISIPNYEATSVTFTVSGAVTSDGSCYLQGGVTSATLKPGQSVSKTFYLKQKPASSDILAYIYVTFTFNGTAIVSTATASGTGNVPTSNVIGFADLNSVKAYFNKVK